MKKSAIIGLLVIFAAIGIIASLLLNTSTYKNFETAFETPDKKVTVNGYLYQPDKIEKIGATTTFWMTDKAGAHKKVIINEALPERFWESEELTVTGHADSDNDLFVANHVLLKCPSKYNGENGEGMEEISVGSK